MMADGLCREATLAVAPAGLQRLGVVGLDIDRLQVAKRELAEGWYQVAVDDLPVPLDRLAGDGVFGLVECAPSAPMRQNGELE